jgi:manganese/iron transport system permease protein
VTELIAGPFRSPYMVRALLEVLLLAVMGGVLGVHVVLRRLAFVSEALQHTVFPGIAVAFVVGGDLLVGAVLAALLTVALLAVLTRTRRVDRDGALAVLTATSFAAGVVIVSRAESFQHDLTVLLFGRILSVDRAQLVETAVLALIVTAVLSALHKELVLAAFDREGAAALGYRPFVLEVVLNVVLALVVVAAIRAVGTVLVVAFVVTPAATALMVTRSVARAMAAAVMFAAACGCLGLVVSFDASVHGGVTMAAGATIVAVMTSVFGVVAAATSATRAMAARRAVGP